MNKNELASSIAKKEGGKKQISIAQVKEVIKIMEDELYADLQRNGTLYNRMINSGEERFKKNESK